MRNDFVAGHALRGVTLFVLGIVRLAFTSAAPADDAPSLNTLLQPFVAKHELAGAVAVVADRNQILALEMVGFSDVSLHKPMTKDAMFWIASQSKPMTATAVMMLVDEGRISLDDAVETHLPEFKGQMVVTEKSDDQVTLQRPVRPVTIRDILSHMSGLPFRSAIEEPTLDGLPLRVAVQSYAMTSLQTQPGTRYQYSNAGINTAARILEVLSGMPYEDFMQQRLFNPLGMKDTTFWPNEEQVTRIAKSYRPNPEKEDLIEIPVSQLTYPLNNRTQRFPMPAGGLFSTATDTAIFCQMLLNGGEWNGRQIISKAALKELSSRQTPGSVKESYGLGFALSPDGFGHGGAQATSMHVYPEEGIVIVWMVQHAGFPGEGARAQGVFRNWATSRSWAN
ncbi:MAG: serine hydrolase domain-containing protein [Planctomycetaceae bacterium]